MKIQKPNIDGAIRYRDQNQVELEANEEAPETLPLIPLRNAVIFPGVQLPIFIGKNFSVCRVIEEEVQVGAFVALFTQRYPHQEEELAAEDLYPTGALAEIHRIVPVNKDGYQVFLQGVQKIKLEELIQEKAYAKARISLLTERKDAPEKKCREFHNRVLEYIKIHPEIPSETTDFVRQLRNPSAIANQLVSLSQRNIKEHIAFLEIEKLSEKLYILNKGLTEEMNCV